MQAIRTKYFGPSNVRGSRIQAKCEAKTIYVGFAHELNSEGNHQAACEELVRQMGWDLPDCYTPMVGGVFGGDYYWVFTNNDSGDGSHSPTTFSGKVSKS